MAAMKYWLWLSAQSVSPQAKIALIRHYGDAETAWFAPAGEYEKIAGINKKDAQRLEARELSVADRIIRDCKAQGIEMITLQDAAYPKLLKNIPAPPVVLYVKGRLPSEEEMPSIAVIGTRKASSYGLKMGQSIAFEISKCGGAVISMLGEGVDRQAARGCLRAEGCCIGILGTGHGAETPFQRDILKNGALISEYPPGIKSQKHFFRERNRIASGLSRGVVVVEAPEQSGALLFAAEALEQGREIFAVPGNADSAMSVGSNELIKQGAKPVTCGWDVMGDFEYLYPGKIKKPGVDFVMPELPEQPEEQAAPKTQETTIKAVDKPKTTEYIDLRAQLSGLDAEQLQIISAIEGNDTHIDDLIERTGMSTAKVLSQLTVLEIRGFVRRSAGRRISLNIKPK